MKVGVGVHAWMGERTETAENNTPWMKHKSLGRAFMPSERLISLVNSWEPLFKKFHGSTVSRVQDPIPKLSLIIKNRFPDIDVGIINAYSKCRFFLRLKELNLNLDVVGTQFNRRDRSHKNKYDESAAAKAGKKKKS